MNPITTSLRATTKRSSGRVALFRVGCVRDARLRLGASHIAQPQTQGEIEFRPLGTADGDADILGGNSHEYSGERLTSHVRRTERPQAVRNETDRNHLTSWSQAVRRMASVLLLGQRRKRSTTPNCNTLQVGLQTFARLAMFFVRCREANPLILLEMPERRAVSCHTGFWPASCPLEVRNEDHPGGMWRQASRRGFPSDLAVIYAPRVMLGMNAWCSAVLVPLSCRGGGQWSPTSRGG